MSSQLDQISAKAASVAGEARVASRHIANIADAAGQMRSRQNVAAEIMMRISSARAMKINARPRLTRRLPY